MPGPVKRPPETEPSAVVGLLVKSGQSGPVEVPDPRPYQTRRVMKVKVEGETVELEDWGWSKRGLERWFRACPKVTVTIKHDPGSNPSDPESNRPWIVIYDGHPFEPIPRGEPYDVPAPIAEIILQGQQQHRTLQSANIDPFTITDRNPRGAQVGGEE